MQKKITKQGHISSGFTIKLVNAIQEIGLPGVA